MKIYNQPLTVFLKKNVILVLLIGLATFLRTYQLETHGIFFFDAGHDLLAAHQAVESGTLPLVGITSSRPWLHQGPLAIWLEMLVMVFFGTSTLAQHTFFALLSIAAIIVLYELVTIHLSKKAAYYAVAILAVSPLAIAASRMPYHTTPIPLATVCYLWALTALWKNYSPTKLVLVVLSGLLLFQFELSNAPLLILIPYVFIRKKYPINIKILSLAIGVGLLAVLPQLLYPLMGGTNQVFEFGKWFIAQILERFQVGISSDNKTINTLQAFWLFGGRMFGVDSIALSLIGFVTTLAASIFAAFKLYKKDLPPVVEVALVCFVVLVGAYFVAGPPSEAYFPPFFILVPILLGYFFSQQRTNIQIGVSTALVLFIVVNVYGVFAANFFVMNNRAFQYDSVGEHRAIAHTLHSRTNQKPYRLTTTYQSELVHPAFFDHIRWLTVAEGLQQPATSGRLYYLEMNADPQPAQTIIIQKFSTKTLYWNPTAGQFRQ